MAKLKEVTLDDLTVAEIFAILGNPFCTQAKTYLKFGNDLRAAWKQAYENEQHYRTLLDKLNLQADDPFPDEVIDDIQKHLNPKTVDDDWLRDLLRKSIASHCWKELPEDPEADENEYQVMRNHIHDALKGKLEEDESFGLKLIKAKKGKKKNEAKRDDSTAGKAEKGKR